MGRTTKLPTVREHYQGRFFKIDSFMEQQLREAREARAQRAGCCSSDMCCGSAESCVRCCRLLRFMVTSLASLTLAVGPWVVSTAEVSAMLCYYFLVVPTALFTKQPLRQYHFSFYTCVEDVLLISLARGVAVLLAYFLGAGKSYQRPYLYAAIAFAVLGLPYAGTKLVVFHFPATDWLPYLTIMCINLGYTVFHLLTAQRVMAWAKRRYHMGLVGFGYPWQVGEEAWMLHHNYREAGSRVDTSDADVDPQQLADQDSRFITIGRIRIHYKIWETRVVEVAQRPRDGIVLAHGFGGGTFAWRHVAQELADVMRCKVLAFDRPGFGLTSRPSIPRSTPVAENPYSSPFQAWMMMQLCGAVGLERVVLVGHSDGALVTLMAAALLRQLSPLEPREGAATGQEGLPEPLQPFPLQQMTSQQPAVALEHAWMTLKLTDSLATQSASTVLQRERSFDGEDWKQLLHDRLDKAESKRQEGADSSPGAARTAMQAAVLDRRKPAVAAAVASTQHSSGESSTTPAHTADSTGTHAADSLSALQQPLLSNAHQGDGNGLTPVEAAGVIPIKLVTSGKSGDWAPPATPRAPGDPEARQGPALRPPVVCAYELAEGSERAEEGGWSGGQGGSGGVGQPGDFCMVAALDQFSGIPEIVVDSTEVGSVFSSDPASTMNVAGAPGCRSTGPAEPQDLSRVPSQAYSRCSSSLLAVETFPQVLGVALLHPSLLGEVRPTFARVLANSGLGRRVLRPLLRSEIGEVSNRAAWFDHSLISEEVLQLYKAPLRVKGWDEALLTVCRMRRDIDREDVGALLSDVDGLPALVVTGVHDRVVPAHRAQQISSSMRCSRLVVLPDCGHLSNEERPADLVSFLVPFCKEALYSELPSAQSIGSSVEL